MESISEFLFAKINKLLNINNSPAIGLHKNLSLKDKMGRAGSQNYSGNHCQSIPPSTWYPCHALVFYCLAPGRPQRTPSPRPSLISAALVLESPTAVSKALVRTSFRVPAPPSTFRAFQRSWWRLLFLIETVPLPPKVAGIQQTLGNSVNPPFLGGKEALVSLQNTVISPGAKEHEYLEWEKKK